MTSSSLHAWKALVRNQQAPASNPAGSDAPSHPLPVHAFSAIPRFAWLALRQSPKRGMFYALTLPQRFTVEGATRPAVLEG